MRALIPSLRPLARWATLLTLAGAVACSVACVIGPKQDDPAEDKGVNTNMDGGLSMDASIGSDTGTAAVDTDVGAPADTGSVPSGDVGAADSAGDASGDAPCSDAADAGDACTSGGADAIAAD